MAQNSLETRVAALERQNRTLRWALLALGICAAAAVLPGAAPDGAGRDSVSQAAPAGPQRLVALGLRIVDADGKVRAELGGENGLVLFDHGGKPSAVLAAAKEGPALRLLDRKGMPRAVLEVGGEAVRLGLADRDGSVLALLRTDAEGTNLSVSDAKGRPRVRLGVLKEQAGLAIRAEKDQTALDLTIDGKAPLLRLCDGRGQPRLSLLGGEDGPAVRLHDPKGAVRASLGRLPMTVLNDAGADTGRRAQTAEGSLVLTDDKGLVVVELPERPR